LPDAPTLIIYIGNLEAGSPKPSKGLFGSIWEASPRLSSENRLEYVAAYEEFIEMMIITQGPIALPKRVLMGLALWIAAELCAFALIVSYLGVAGAILLGLVTSLMGFSLLRRLGQDAASSLKQVFGTQGRVLKPESMVDGTISAIAGVLLILPGFLSDLVGLALSAPSIRLWLAHRMQLHGRSWTAQTRPRRRDQVIELDDREWRRLDDTAPDLRGHR
jgi:UPF0716 protein FxsA